MILEDQYKQETGKEAIATYKAVPVGTGAGFTSKLVVANYNNDFVEWLKKRDEYKTRRCEAAEKVIETEDYNPSINENSLYFISIKEWQSIVNEEKE